MSRQPPVVKQLLLGNILLVMAVPLAAADDRPRSADIPLREGSIVRFAAKAEAREFLTQRDRYLLNLGRFDRQSRLATDTDVTLEQLLDHIQSQILDWTADEQTLVAGLCQRIAGRIQQLPIPLPPTVFLIKSTGREESDAAYCRGAAIVLPLAFLRRPEADLERILAHELFHIVSNHAPATVQSMYPLVGFTPVPPIALPPDLADRKITNPDAPLVNCVMDLTLDDQPAQVAPVIFSKSPTFDPAQGRSFFPYLVFRLMVVERRGERWVPVLEADQPRFVNPTENEQFLRKIGRNTKYILHPEEILADNFVHLVFATPDLPNPEIPAGMREILTRQP